MDKINLVENSEESFFTVLFAKTGNQTKYKQMIIYSYKYVPIIIGTLLIVCILTGCKDSGEGFLSESGDEYLIRVKDSVVKLCDFNTALENLEAIYPINALQDDFVLKEARVRLLNQLIEETILAERAKELNLEISDSELENAISNIKKDYPDNNFDLIFIQNAISYNLWVKGLKSRLLMEKIIKKDLVDKVNITSENISDYYEEYYKENRLNSNFHEEGNDLNRKIIRHLRRQKAEKAYKEWIGHLKQEYTIEINHKLWEKIDSMQ